MAASKKSLLTIGMEEPEADEEEAPASSKKMPSKEASDDGFDELADQVMEAIKNEDAKAFKDKLRAAIYACHGED